MTKKKGKIFAIIAGILFLLCLLLRIPTVKDQVSSAIGVPVKAVGNFVLSAITVVVGFALGALAIVVGAALPVVAVVIAVVAVAAVVWGLWNFFNPPGQKPENTTLDGKL